LTFLFSTFLLSSTLLNLSTRSWIDFLTSFICLFELHLIIFKLHFWIICLACQALQYLWIQLLRIYEHLKKYIVLLFHIYCVSTLQFEHLIFVSIHGDAGMCWISVINIPSRS
jgi:hypothetical protein